MARHRMSIRARLLTLVLACLLPVFGFLAWFLDHEAGQAREAASIQLKLVADNIAASLAQTLRDDKELLGFIGDEFRGNPPVRASRLDPDQVMRMHPQIVSFGVRDLRADNIFTHLATPIPADKALEFPWVQQGLQSETFVIGGAINDSVSGRWLTVLTYPVRGGDGQRSGFVNLSHDLLALNRQVMQAVPAGAQIAVLDQDFRFLLSSTEPEKWIGKALDPASADIYRGSAEGYGRAPGVTGIPYQWAFVGVPGTGWRVSVGMAEVEVLAPARALVVRGGILGGAALLLQLAIAWWIAAGINRPISHLEITAAAIASGNGRVRASSDGPAEVAAVARQFNAMLDSIERDRVEREVLSSRYGTLLKNARDIILLVDMQGSIVEANDAAFAAYGYSAEELRALDVDQLRTAAAQADIDKDERDALGPQGVLFETEHRRKDGSSFPVEVSSRIVEVDGSIYRQKFIRDISARREAGAAIQRQLDELRRWYDVMLNREDRIRELKQEVNQLLALAEQPPRYASVEVDSVDAAVTAPPAAG